MSSLKNDAERVVVRTLVDRLTDGWLVLPSVGLSDDDRAREIDVVVAHPRDGIAVIEVKGHRPSVREGRWYSRGRPIEPQPHDQAADNAYALRRRIRGFHPTLSRVLVAHAVAFPNVADIDGRLPTDVDRTQVITSADLDGCLDAVERLVFRRTGPPLGGFGIQQVVELLRPNCDFRYEPETFARHARARLDELCVRQTQALESLDLNRRVCVTGAAGTGKSRLAAAWARRALLREERVLLTCFNIPLAESLRQRLGESEQLHIGAFHEVALELEGMPPLDTPDTADREWWNTVEIGHLHAHWHEITHRFDTIIVDEAQDFRPAWIGLLERLLDRDGPRRLLLLADTSQEVYVRGFELPSADDGWTRAALAATAATRSASPTSSRRASTRPSRPPVGRSRRTSGGSRRATSTPSRRRSAVRSTTSKTGTTPPPRSSSPPSAARCATACGRTSRSSRGTAAIPWRSCARTSTESRVSSTTTSSSSPSTPTRTCPTSSSTSAPAAPS